MSTRKQVVAGHLLDTAIFTKGTIKMNDDVINIILLLVISEFYGELQNEEYHRLPTKT